MILVIVGPTGVGKTKMSIELAKIYDGEIVNADSMQVYKNLDVGTAKATLEERQGIVHHLLDIKDVTEDYTVYDYQRDARRVVDDILKRGKVPIIVGGTGLYIKALLYDYHFFKYPNKNNYDNLSNEELVKKINSYQKDIDYDQYNRRRLVSILNKLEQGWEPKKEKLKLIYDDVYFIGLTTDREKLYDIINKRFDKMIKPLIEEVKPYYLKHIESKALKTGIGYKELESYFNKEKTLEEVVEECKKNSRNYAKRQYTWFKRQMPVVWFKVDYDDFLNTVRDVANYVEKNRNI